MNRLTMMLTGSALTRSKMRAGFLLLAITAASCLVVWTVGGYQALFTDVSTVERPLGRYDLKTVAAKKRGPGGPGGTRPGGGFGGPFASAPKADKASAGNKIEENKTESKPDNSPSAGPGNGGPDRIGRGRGGRRPDLSQNEKRPKYDPFESARVRDGSLVLERLPEDIPAHIREKLVQADNDGNGVLSLAEERTFYDASPRDEKPLADTAGITVQWIEQLRADEQVAECDALRRVRGFLFSPNARPNSMAEEGIREAGEADSAYEEIVPEGIDPELHRLGLAAYRSVMGTPAGLGTEFYGIEAERPPFEIEEGRWFLPEEKNAGKVVLGLSASKKWAAHPGDKLWLLTKTREFQLEVVGILDGDPDEGIFVPIGFADLVDPQELPVYDGLGIVLNNAEAVSDFRQKWGEKIQKILPDSPLMTNEEAAEARQQAADSANTFHLQSAAGSLLAVLASVMIIFTALSIGVEERRREIALLRSIGLSRRQIAFPILLESMTLAVPGWLGGLLAGWLILAAASGKMIGLNINVVSFSFISAVIGSLAAAFFPMVSACRIAPLEAVTSARIGDRAVSSEKNRRIRSIFPIIGLIFIAADLYLVYGLDTDRAHRAALHSGVGTLLLVIGVLFLLPMLVRAVEKILLPVFAVLLRFDRTISAAELSSHIKRSVGITAALSVGGGLFVLMQVWGYSMLGPFLPNRQMPDAFAAFLPIGLNAESVEELRHFPQINPNRFEPVALEQAAFAPGSVTMKEKGPSGGSFANVIFFGMDVDRSFAGENPLVALRFIEGDQETALADLKTGRKVVVNDALCVDYGLHAGDTLKVTDPKNPNRVLEYEIAGVTTFNGWQWLSKTGGLRRNFGRSGGIVFASDQLIRDDYHLKEPAYFWFDTVKGTEYTELETALDRLARKNFNASDEGKTGVNSAYVKLSTRESLYRSIADRADGVIWGLSLMPIVTLVLTSIALAAVTVNSVRVRRRWFGMMRSIGVERSCLFRMILTESVLLGLTAAFASLLFGIPAASGALKLGRSMFGIADPALVLPMRGLLFGLGTLILLSLLAAWVPAWKIGKAQPLDLLDSKE